MTFNDNCKGSDTVDNNFASTSQDGGYTLYNFSVAAFSFTPSSRCLSLIEFVKVKKYSGHIADLKISIRENWTGYDIPKNESLKEYTKTNNTLSTNYTNFGIDTVLLLSAANVPYWILMYSSDYGCCETTDVDGCDIGDCNIEANKRFEATPSASNLIKVPIARKSLMKACKNGVSRNCQWTSPGLGSLAFATYKKGYTEPPPSCTFNVS